MEKLKIIIELIERVLFKKMNSLEELYQAWPETKTDSELFESIYDDVEGVIEHLSLTQDKIDEKLFHESIAYRNLVIDYKVLNRGFNLELTTKLINELRAQKNLSIIDIDEKLSHL